MFITAEVRVRAEKIEDRLNGAPPLSSRCTGRETNESGRHATKTVHDSETGVR
jgi:hypothetical protein